MNCCRAPSLVPRVGGGGGGLGQGPARGLSPLISSSLQEVGLSQPGPGSRSTCTCAMGSPALGALREGSRLSLACPLALVASQFWLAGASCVHSLPFVSVLDVDTQPLPLGARREALRRGEGFSKVFTPGSATGNKGCREQRR